MEEPAFRRLSYLQVSAVKPWSLGPRDWAVQLGKLVTHLLVCNVQLQSVSQRAALGPLCSVTVCVAESI